MKKKSILPLLFVAFLIVVGLSVVAASAQPLPTFPPVPTPQPFTPIIIDVLTLADGRYGTAAAVDLFYIDPDRPWWTQSRGRLDSCVQDWKNPRACVNPARVRFATVFVGYSPVTGEPIYSLPAPGEYHAVATNNRGFGRSQKIQVTKGGVVTIVVNLETAPAAVTDQAQASIDRNGLLTWAPTLEVLRGPVVVETYLEGPTRTSEYMRYIIDSFRIEVAGSNIKVERRHQMSPDTPEGWHYVSVYVRDADDKDPAHNFKTWGSYGVYYLGR